uniref:Minor capsid protein n=1 Tax=Gokushovirinae environmental samples TaxID=1478972 RepID=A0A2R3UAK3_9VIRU|nr:minor capsid protein [Gokushovirinae environmental samples]
MFGLDDVLTGGLSLLGGVANNLFAGQRQSDAQAFNAQQAAMNREFQERMDNTKYQRTANDMQAAGLNRILAVGSPGSAPSGNMATSSPGAPVHDMLGPAVNTAMARERLSQELLNMKETNKNIATDTMKKDVEATNVVADTSRKIAETSKLGDETKIIVEKLMQAKLEADEARIKREQLENPAFRILHQTGNIGKEMERASSALGNVPALINARNKGKTIDLQRDTFKERFGVP